MYQGVEYYIYFVSATWIYIYRIFITAMCSALASGAIDNCHPVLLVEGEHSSSTAKSLRDAFQPLHSAMHTLHTSLAQDNQSKFQIWGRDLSHHESFF